MTFGVVTEVEARTLGSELVVAAVAGDTVLQVDLVSDFDEDGGTLILNGIQLAYTTVDPELETITLAAPLVVAADEDDPVFQVEGGGSTPGVLWTAYVSLDEGDNVAAEIPTNLISYFPEGQYDVPAPVEVRLNGDTYEVVSQPEVAPVFNGATVWNPRANRNMVTQTIPNATWTQVTGWVDVEVDGLTVSDGVTVPEDGTYLILAKAAFLTNGIGRRGIRLMVDGVDTEYFVLSADSSGLTYAPVFDSARLTELSKVTVEVFQSSGAGLALANGSFNMFRTSV